MKRREFITTAAAGTLAAYSGIAGSAEHPHGRGTPKGAGGTPKERRGEKGNG